MQKLILNHFTLQNLLFYYDSSESVKPIGVIFLEGCFCERVLNPTTGSTSTAGNQSGNKSDQNRLSEKMVKYLVHTLL